eukprot:86541_1
MDEMQQKWIDSQTKIETLQEENQRLRNELEKHTKSPIKSEINRHGSELWKQIEVNCLKDPDAVKVLVKTKQITVNDMNTDKRTLLLVAACVGSYDMVQFCINAGFDITHKDKWDCTALDNAIFRSFYHIEQLLLFSAMNLSLGNEVKRFADTIHRQNGINHNITNELRLIGDQSSDLFEKTLMEIMINTITKKQSFSDQLLSYCWAIACRNGQDPLSSDLWNVISSTCSDIIRNRDKRDWFWFKTCILPSTVWYKEVTIQKETGRATHYLYFELLKLVENESKNQLKKLEHDLHDLAGANQQEWNTFVTWDVVNQYETARQDLIPNGITSRYTYNHLLEKSGSAFNSTKFYDFNEYLSQLVLLAQIVDDEFQQSIQQMFGIDKVTHQGTFTENKTGDGLVEYMRGPVKLLQRARNKAENDYLDAAYPQSACVLDLNRCALIFNDTATILRAMKLFVNKIRYYQSGSIIGIVRAKNGFIDYLQSTQYADIKLNVLLRGKQNNIIGEVQFLLRRMKEYKDIAHNLYALERTKEAIESSVSVILPLLLDAEKQLFIAGNMGSVKEICKVMVINNKTSKDIMKADKDQVNILHNICRFGHRNLFFYLKSILSTEAFVSHVFSPDNADITPFEYGLRSTAVSIVKDLLNMKQIRSMYSEKRNIFRLVYWLFAWNLDMEFARYVLSVLDIRKKTVSKMMAYKYPAPARTFGHAGKRHYHRFTILCEIARCGTYNALKTLVSIVGEKTFISHVLDEDYHGKNTMQYALENEKPKMVRYMIQSIRMKCMEDTDVLHGVISLLNKYFDASMGSFVIKTLNLNKKKLNELKEAKSTDITKIVALLK